MCEKDQNFRPPPLFSHVGGAFDIVGYFSMSFASIGEIKYFFFFTVLGNTIITPSPPPFELKSDYPV